MRLDSMIKWTNRIALFSVVFLFYWVFIFISMTVFGFKIFQENITETFYFSIMGILALLSGSIVLNIMLNLTKMSDALEKESPATKSGKYGGVIVAFLVSFPVLFGLLYLGDKQSSLKNERIIKSAAKSLVEENQEMLNQFSAYTFDKTWVKKTKSDLKLLEQIDESFPDIELIIQDEIEGKQVFLGFDSYYYYEDDDNDVAKVNFIYSCSSEERDYLANAFKGGTESRFSASDGHYELYYPVKAFYGTIVLRLSERQRYGKRGS